jgi:hypothetical protein
MDTLTNPRAVIGGNEPPLADRLALDHAELLRLAAEAAALVPAELRPIADDEEAAAFTDTAADIKGIIAQADAAFTVEKAPWLAGGRAVDDFFAFRKDLAAAVKRVTAALNARADAIRAAVRRAEAEAAAAAKAAADAETERLRKEAAAFDEEPPAPVAPVYVAPVAVKDAARVVSGATGNKASVSTKWLHNVTDPAAVPREYLMPDDEKIKLAVKRGVRSIPGVEIFEAANTAIRRR